MKALTAGTVALGCALTLACGGDGGNGQQTGVTVNGQLRDSHDLPLAGLTVMSGSQTTTTGANGNFTLTNITTPYDLTLISTTRKIGVVYKGLTRKDPTLRDFGFGLSGGFASSGHIRGTVSGGAPLPGSGDTETWLVFTSPQSPSGIGTNSIIAPAYDLAVSWSGPTSISGTLHALQTTYGTNGLPSGYTYGSRQSVTVADGTETDGADVTLASVSTLALAGAETVPTGYTLGGRFLWIYFDAQAYVPVSTELQAAPGFSYLLPDLPGATATLLVEATQGASYTATVMTGLAPGTSDAGVVLRTAAVPSLPPPSATGVTTSTDFAWSPFTGGIHLFFATAGPSQPTYFVVTAGTTTRLPDLAAQGLPLPSGQRYEWGVSGEGPLGSVDAFVGPELLSRTTIHSSLTGQAFTTQ